MPANKKFKIPEIDVDAVSLDDIDTDPIGVVHVTKPSLNADFSVSFIDSNKFKLIINTENKNLQSSMNLLISQNRSILKNLFQIVK